LVIVDDGGLAQVALAELKETTCVTRCASS
jgi:hypothetical protein